MVADAVRSLAKRAAEAAGETAELISVATERVQSGDAHLECLRTHFSEIEHGAAEAVGIIGNVTATLNEQAHGIENAARTVSEMKDVTLENNLSAERAQQALERITTQVETLSALMKQLAQLSGG